MTLGTHGTSELVLGCDGLRVEGGAVGASRQRLRILRALGIPERSAREWAGSRKGYWRIAGSAPLQRSLPNAYWTGHGLRTFTDNYHRLRAC